MSNLLVVAALKDEVREIKNKMAIDCTIHFKPAILYRGLLFQKEVRLLVTGMGFERMQNGLALALEKQLPSSILFIGYAGGTTPVVSLAHLVLAEKVVRAEEEKLFGADKASLGVGKKVCVEKKLDHHIGTMVTVDHVIGSPHEKADIGAVHGAIALDMEAAALAQVASQRNIPWLVVKAILDPMEMELPNLQECMEATGEVKPILMMEHFLKNPREVTQLTQIQYNASQARQALAQFVEGWMGLS